MQYLVVLGIITTQLMPLVLKTLVQFSFLQLRLTAKKYSLKSFAGSKAIGVNPNTKYPQVAVALASFLGSTEAQKEHYKTRNTIPTDKSLLEDPEIASDALATAQGNTIANTSIMQPFVAGMSNYCQMLRIWVRLSFQVM